MLFKQMPHRLTFLFPVGDELRLSLAGLTIEIVNGVESFDFDYSPCHEKFLSRGQTLKPETEILRFEMVDSKTSPDLSPDSLLYRNEIFEVWRNPQNQLTFTQASQKPQRWIRLEPNFEHGLIIGDFKASNGKMAYPLQYIDIVIFSNWLANFGDLLLHASGIIWEGEGYCFIGHSGAGKSTLARDLREEHGLTVMGEDQIVLRKLDGQLMVFGTPWHETADMCAYGGVPLKKIFFLNRSASQIVSRVNRSDAVLRLLQTAFYPIYRPEIIGGIMDRLIELSDRVDFFELAYERGSDILSEILKA